MAELAIDVDTRVWDQFVRAFPKIVNQEQNKSFRRYARAFGTRFTRARLRKGIFKPRRRVTLSRPRRGQPTLPAAMRRAGFTAEIRNVPRLEGKVLRISTSNPLLVGREKRVTIRPRKGKFLFVRSKRNPRKIGAKLREVRQPPLLFEETFRSFRPQGTPILQRGMDEAVRRGQMKIEARAG